MGQAAGSKPFPKAAAASAVVGMLLLGIGAMDFEWKPVLHDCGCTGSNAAAFQAPAGSELLASRASVAAAAKTARTAAASASSEGSPLPFADAELRDATVTIEDSASAGGSSRPFDSGRSAGLEPVLAMVGAGSGAGAALAATESEVPPAQAAFLPAPELTATVRAGTLVSLNAAPGR
jgi:hypothetical protein